MLRMKIGLVGWGIETQSAFRFFGDSHEYLIVNEEPRDDFPSGQNIRLQTLDTARRPGLTGNAQDYSYLKRIETCDVVVLSPTARKVLEKVYTPHDDIWTKTTSNLQLFFENCPSKNTIGITGTKGKGTTTTLIAKMLEAGGKTVHIGGNIGIAALDLLPNIMADDWVVLEISNFQLYKFHHSPHIAVHLMMMPEHIEEWHGTFEDYIEAKSNIFRWQSKDDIAIYLPKNQYSTHNADLSPGKHIPYMQPPGAFVKDDAIIIDNTVVINTNDVGLRGAHNLENVCAAITAVWNVHQNVESMRKVIAEFTGLEHRLQTVRVIDNVQYVDDSFGTTPDTAIVAMNTYDQPKVMIIGGHDKGSDMTKMIDRLSETDIRSVIGIGPLGNFMVDQLQKKQIDGLVVHRKEEYNNWSMQEIVDVARNDAQKGDVILLSAGTSSFGIFKDYKDRGNQFIQTVNDLS